MPTVDLVDETFLVVDRAVLAAEVATPARWREWWPHLTLEVFMDRGVQGVRWNVRGALVGSAEVWLEAVGDGVVLHHYLRVDPADGPLDVATARGRRRADRLRDRHARAWKRTVWALADRLDEQRAPGEPRA